MTSRTLNGKWTWHFHFHGGARRYLALSLSNHLKDYKWKGWSRHITGITHKSFQPRNNNELVRKKNLFCINVAKKVISLLLTICVITFNNHRRLCDRECTPKVLKFALMTMLGLKQLTGAHLRRYNTNSSHIFLGIARPAEHLWIVSESSRQWRWWRDEGRAGRSGGEGKACGLGSGSRPTHRGGQSHPTGPCGCSFIALNQLMYKI